MNTNKKHGPETPEDFAAWLESQMEKNFNTPAYMTHLEASGYHANAKEYREELKTFQREHPFFK